VELKRWLSSDVVSPCYTTTCCDAFHYTSLLPSASHPHRNRPKLAITPLTASNVPSRRMRWTCRAAAQSKTSRWRVSSSSHLTRTKHKQLHICTALSIGFGLLLNRLLHKRIFRTNHLTHIPIAMSPAHTDTDIPLPHASLLAYFRNPAAGLEARERGTSPEIKSKGFGARHFLHTRNKSAESEDEESKCGFWGERSSLEDDAKILSDSTTTWGKKSVAKRAAAFCCFWFAFSIVILGASGLYFFADLALSHYGLGTRMSQLVTYRHSTYEVSPTQYTLTQSTRLTLNLFR
jgi:hypothetical protein